MKTEKCPMCNWKMKLENKVFKCPTCGISVREERLREFILEQEKEGVEKWGET